jgi:tRNA-2-methylthio-N6-dimethylallyladenosine synthase
METTRRTFRVKRKDIHYIRTTLESYDGMAVVGTRDPYRALVEVCFAPGCETQVMNLIRDLKRTEGLSIKEESRKGPPVGREEAGRPRFAVLTMGCQMNVYDSDYASRCLIRAGYAPASDPEDAKVLVVNTCSVREKAEHKAFSTLGRMAALKRRDPTRVLVFAGCVAQQEGEALLKRFPEVDIVLGTRRIPHIAELVNRVREKRERVASVELESAGLLRALSGDHYFSGRVQGSITIMQGCNNFCSYCIVPYVRGREQSRSPVQVVAEAEDLLEQGVREIMLLGQNVNSYFWDEGPGGPVDFSALLRLLDDLPGLARLRFTTSHPKDLSDALIRCFHELGHLCGHIHLPFQAGSDRILKRMNRRYTREHYLDRIRLLREARPDVAVTADVMVGFPGETRKDFEETLDLVRTVRFDSLYSFKYSDRKGTAAAAFDEKVDEQEKRARLMELQALQHSITLEKNQALEGREVEVLVEGASKKGEQLTGRTECNKVVNFVCNSCKIGDIVKVRISKGYAHSLQAVDLTDSEGAHMDHAHYG